MACEEEVEDVPCSEFANHVCLMLHMLTDISAMLVVPARQGWVIYQKLDSLADKDRCDGNNPCATCVSIGHDCTYGSEANS
jgi:hypothetical protein